MRWAALQYAGAGSASPAQELSSGSAPAIAEALPARAQVELFPAAVAAVPEPGFGTTEPRRIVLDLCGGSGSWAVPYVEAGYDVRTITLPDGDVRTYVPPPNVHGVLAAPPCTEFSLAKNGQARNLVVGMETVNACMRIILQSRPKWWALENPTGLLGHYLGRPRDVFEPCDFGDPWTKRTAIWGDFAIPERGPFVKPTGSAMDRSTAAERAITPPGFARAFFASNP
ncbi:MAG: DNA cytosine methyltransferase [Myxococcaceae bacterium]